MLTSNSTAIRNIIYYGNRNVTEIILANGSKRIYNNLSITQYYALCTAISAGNSLEDCLNEIIGQDDDALKNF